MGNFTTNKKSLAISNLLQIYYEHVYGGLFMQSQYCSLSLNQKKNPSSNDDKPILINFRVFKIDALLTLKLFVYKIQWGTNIVNKIGQSENLFLMGHRHFS